MSSHYQVAKEEMAFFGEKDTSLQNLLAIIIGPKACPKLTGTLASMGIDKLSNLTVTELMNFEGIGEIMATRISTVFHLSERINYYRREKNAVLLSPDDVAEEFRYMRDYKQEYLDVAFLTIQHEIIARKNIFKGSLTSSIVHPREIFREAVKLSAAGIIMVHNHPSFDPTPTEADISITSKIVEAGKSIGIPLLDHVIIGGNNFTSLKEKGYIE